MSAGFLQTEISSQGLLVEVHFNLENRSEQTWKPEEGFCVGWQLFDPATSLFIAEGEWQPLKTQLGRGQRERFSVPIAMPGEPGRYHVYVSARDRGGWHYEKEWPFLLVEVSVAGEMVQSSSVEPVTRGSLRRRGSLRKIAKAFSEPVSTLWRNRRLIGSLTKRDIAGRYRGSAGDLLWALLHPLLLMLTYFFVFGIVLQARFGQDPSRSGFVLYFLAGMLPWLPFSDAVARAPGIVWENRNFVKKLVFPVEILPVNPVLAALVGEVFALLVFLVLLVLARGGIPWTVAWLPILVAPQLMLTLAVCWTLSALGVYLRDLGQMIGFVLTVVFFLTPICYPEASLPASAIPFLSKSPIFLLVREYRGILLEARSPEPGPLLLLYLGTGLACLAAYAWFTRLKRSFADVI
ncbi:MAG: ABC transporter permease [Acidobacteriia bacterium]|nr:ABC transporter permease [Terriglobia bacterium]